MVAGSVSTQAVSNHVDCKRLWKAMVKDGHNVFPKVLPELIASVSVQGNGGVGSIRQINFTPANKDFSYSKERIDEIDDENFVFKYTAVEGGQLGKKLSSAKFELKLVPNISSPPPPCSVKFIMASAYPHPLRIVYPSPTPFSLIIDSEMMLPSPPIIYFKTIDVPFQCENLVHARCICFPCQRYQPWLRGDYLLEAHLFPLSMFLGKYRLYGEDVIDAHEDISRHGELHGGVGDYSRWSDGVIFYPLLKYGKFKSSR
eukprot:Gb_33504 [translate_table: standard]